MVKNILTFLSIILICAALFLSGYLVSKKIGHQEADIAQATDALTHNSLVNRFKETTAPSVAPSTSSIPKGIFQITIDHILFPKISIKNTKVTYYDSASGEIRTLDIKSPNQKEVIGTIKPGATSLQWAGNARRLIASYASGAVYYDFDSHITKVYDQGITSPALNQAGDKIVYVYVDKNTGSGDISIADTELTTFKNILATRDSNWSLAWVNDQTIAMSQKTDDQKTTVFTLDINQKQLQKIIDSRYIADTQWSSDGKRLLYLYYTDGNGLKAGVFDRSQNAPYDIKLPSNATRCAWSIDSKTVYCATEDENSVKDQKHALAFIKLDASSAANDSIEIHKEPGQSLKIRTIVPTLTEDFLLFTDLNDGGLYGLKLD